jgi:hypothetical protein
MIRAPALLVLGVLLAVGMDCHSQSIATPKGLPWYTLNVPKFFPTVQAIKLYFDQQGVPAELAQVKGTSHTYCFVTAHPYSGIDTTDLYCFVKRDEKWEEFLKAYLFRTPFQQDVQFKTDGDFVDVLCKGIVSLKINPPGMQP